MAVLVVVIVVFVAFGYRVVQLQALEPDRYVALSEAQTLRTQTLAAGRGSIYDRNGYELALSIPQRTVFTDPRFVDDPVATAAALAPILDVPAAELEEKLVADNRFGYLARQVPDAIADQVAALELDGVYFIEEPHRFKPSGDLARSLIGLTDIDNAGLGGIELQYQEVLGGTPGTLTYEQDPEGRTIPVGLQELVPAVPGDGVVLSLDRALQFQAERILERHVAANAADGGMLVAMEPSTGEILAMANIELDAETGAPAPTSNNLALTTVYEPGSVMKIIPVAGAMEEGLVSPTGGCVNAPDTLEVAGSTFKEFEPHGGGCWPLADVVVHSSNTASINLALMLGPQRLHGYFDAFGLGHDTGLGFPNESPGSVRPVEDWWGTSIATMPIGQGIAVTPLQMLLAYNTVANDGVFVPPRLVRATVTAHGHERPVAPPEARPVVSASTARDLRSMLAEVTERGTAQSASVAGFSAAGKTGTALVPAPDGGYTWPDGAKRYMATFCGFVPAEDPKLSVCTIVRHPTAGLYTGGSVAGPVFAEFARFGVTHLQVAPPPALSSDADPAAAVGAPTALEPERFYAGLGEPPAGRVRAEPTRTPDPTGSVTSPVANPLATPVAPASGDGAVGAPDAG
jgi:cell division protein FtsI (penicillin-binding protein 3)